MLPSPRVKAKLARFLKKEIDAKITGAIYEVNWRGEIAKIRTCIGHTKYRLYGGEHGLADEYQISRNRWRFRLRAWELLGNSQDRELSNFD